MVVTPKRAASRSTGQKRTHTSEVTTCSAMIRFALQSVDPSTQWPTYAVKLLDSGHSDHGRLKTSDGRFDTEQVCREVETLHNANAGYGVIRTLLSSSTPTRRPATSVKVANLVKAGADTQWHHHS